MATEDLSNVFGSGDSTANGITLDMLDYKYIDGCSNIKELEKILRVLRSGKEGYFPHLVQHCEDKVEKINPKSRSLRKENPVTRTRDLSSDEMNDITSSLDEWRGSITDKGVINGHSDVTNLPPVRTSRSLIGNKVVESEKKSQRIKGSDFRAWDKFDAEAECEKVDEIKPQTVKSNSSNIPLKLDTTAMTGEEVQQKVVAEKEKGNEAFKAGDYEEALAYYTRSINLEPLTATINNRALTYLRLKRWKDAEHDCDTVLAAEPRNLKAMLRRASTRKELGEFSAAKKDLDFVLSEEPNNSRARKILEEVSKSLPSKKGRKMNITEVDDIAPTVTPKDATVTSKDSTVTPKEPPTFKETQTPKDHLTPKDPVTSKDPDVTAVTAKDSLTSEPPHKPPTTDHLIKDPLYPTTNPPLPPKQQPLPSHIEAVKVSGGELFRCGQYSSATHKYSSAIDKTKALGNLDPSSQYAHSTAVLYNNRAACHLKQGDDRSCIADCTVALELKPFDVKALVRRGTAYENLEKYGEAYADFRTAQEVDWTAAQAQTGANRVAAHLRDSIGPKWRDGIVLPKVVPVEARPVATQPRPVASEPRPDAIKEPEVVNLDPTPSEKTTSKKCELKRSPETAKGDNKKKSEVLTAPEIKQTAPLTEMDRKRLKIRRDIYEKCKADGNAAVKRGSYEEAVKSYTKCMEMLPREVPSYTNRALCFLKLKKYISAINDCTEAIELDPRNVKAYFRRAQARRNLLQYHDARNDLNSLLSIDSGNKFAHIELKAVDKLISEQYSAPAPSANLKVEKKPKRKLQIEEISDEDEPSETPANQRETTLTSAASDHASKVVTEVESVTKPSKPEAKPTASEDETKPVEISSSELEKKTASQPTMTPFEFGSQWNAVTPKSNTVAYKQILDRVPVEKIPEIVSNKTNDHMILTFAQIARKYSEENQHIKAFNILNNLTKAQRFNMAAMFLSKSEKNCIAQVFDLISKEIGSSVIDKLRLDYML